jgi:hypothetical protein
MFKKIPTLYKKIRIVAATWPKLGPLLIFIYECLRSPYVKNILTAIFTITIAIEQRFIDFKNIGFHLPEILTAVTILVYLVFLFVNVNVDRVSEALRCRYNYLKEIVNQQTAINHTIAGKLFRVYGGISLKPSYIPTNGDVNILTYQDVGSLICHAIYEIIRVTTGEEGHQVSLLHKFKDQKTGKEYIKMISFGNKAQSTPSVFNNKYILHGNNEKYYHMRIFEENVNKPYILCNNEEVKKEFVENKKSKERDDKIQQYIATPIYCELEGVISLLQIDTDIENMFGSTHSEVEDFIKAFYPYSHQLLVNYYRDNIIKCLVKKVDTDSRKKKEA